MEKSPGLGNPQEITETDKAWLAGIIEGDGALGMAFQVQRATHPRTFAVKPYVSFCNQDALLVEQVVCMFYVLSGKNVHLREVAGNYEHSRSTISLELHGMASVKAVVDAIMPYLRGEKAARARMLHRFLESRFERHGGVRGPQTSATPYNGEELTIIKNLYESGRRKGGKRNPLIGDILRDYTRAIAEKAMKIESGLRSKDAEIGRNDLSLTEDCESNNTLTRTSGSTVTTPSATSCSSPPWEPRRFCPLPSPSLASENTWARP